MPTPHPHETLDILLRGRLRLLQSRQGHRTSVDSLALAWFAGHFLGQRAASESPAVVLDLGAGAGMVALTLGLALPQTRLILVELQSGQADRARRNVQLNGLAERAQVRQHDLADPWPSPLPQADAVLCNPPFRVPGTGVAPALEERRLAHFESTAPLAVFAQRAAQVMAPSGFSAWVFPWADRERLLQALSLAGLQAQVCPLYHREGDLTPVRALVAAFWPVNGRPAEATLTFPSCLALHLATGLEEHYHPDLEAFIAQMPPPDPTDLAAKSRKNSPARSS